MFKINDNLIGPGNPTYVIAELSANHNQSFDKAAAIVRAAAQAGADAIKLQTYTAETLTIDSSLSHFQINQGTAWDGLRLFDLYRSAETPWPWHADLQKLAQKVGLDFFSSPFDETAVDFLESLDVPAYKVASFEIVDIGLLKKIAGTGKPVIVSTGMSTIDEIEQAVKTLQENGCLDIALLKCTSAYPAPPESMNLKTIQDLAKRFQIPVGLSDHTLSSTSAIAAVALGGNIIEKHLTISRADGGPDSHFSLEPHEFSDMVTAIRDAEKSIGKIHYGTTSSDVANQSFRRSLFVVRDVRPGEKFTTENVRSIRPGQGLPPKHFDEVLTKSASQSIPRGTPLSWEHVA
jgi:N-acetylneuraminate synthase